MKTLLIVLVLSGSVACHAASQPAEAPGSALSSEALAKEEPGPKSGAALIKVVAPLHDMHGVRPILGRDFMPADFKGAAVAVISSGLWKTAYASRLNVIGEKLKVADREFVIIGVMPAQPAALEGSIIWLAGKK